MENSGNIQNEVAQSEHVYVDGVGAKKVVLLDAFGSLGNDAEVITGLPTLGNNLTMTKVVNGVTRTQTLVWSGTGPYTLTISTWS